MFKILPRVSPFVVHDGVCLLSYYCALVEVVSLFVEVLVAFRAFELLFAFPEVDA